MGRPGFDMQRHFNVTAPSVRQMVLTLEKNLCDAVPVGFGRLFQSPFDHDFHGKRVADEQLNH